MLTPAQLGKRTIARGCTGKVLVGNGVAATIAFIVARYLIAADFRRMDIHGTNRVPSYME